MEKQKKSKKKKIIAGVAIAAAAVVCVALFLPMAMQGSQVQAADAVVRTAEVTRDSIETTVVGSGSLSVGGSRDIDIPASLEVKTVEVEAGDTVAVGDTLATLDAQSLQTTITEVQDKISSIDSSIKSAQSDTDAATITAGVSGRVKQITAAAGDDVRTITAQNDGLLLLSLDGYMKVELDNVGSLAAGDDVKVAIGENSYDGTVYTVSGGNCTIRFTDNGPQAGETATVTDADGNTIGTGTVEISAPLHVVGNEGTIKKVNVAVDDKVSSSTKLFTLDQSEATLQYNTLLQDRTSYETLLTTLLEYAQTNSIIADFDGTISAVNISGSGSSDTGSGDSANASPMVSTGSGNAAMTLLSSYTGDTKLVSLGASGEETPAGTLEEPQPTPATITDVNGVVEVAVTTPVAGGTPQSEVIPGKIYTGKVTWTPADAAFQAGTVYKATITLTANAGYHFAADVQPQVSGGQIDTDSVQVGAETEKNTLTFTVEFPAAAEGNPSILPDGEQPSQSDSDAAGALAGSSYSFSSGSMSGDSASSSSSVSATATSSTDSSSSSNPSDTQTAFTVATGKADNLTISVDELDILDVEVGQKVQVTLDALPDETFTGTVDSISEEGTSQSGVTTYPVTIVLDDTETRLLPGMNGTGTIVTATSENILTIPLAALQEMGGEKFVFVTGGADQATQAADENTGEATLGEQRTVTTGLSDGTNVEITSGLEEGEEVIYTEAVSTSSFEDMMMSFGGGMVVSGDMAGGPTGGGEPPSGGPSFN